MKCVLVSVTAIAQAAQEVWFGGSTSYSINRLNIDGSPLSSINIGADIMPKA